MPEWRVSVAPGPNCAITPQAKPMSQLFGLCPLVWTCRTPVIQTVPEELKHRSPPPEILIYAQCSSELGDQR